MWARIGRVGGDRGSGKERSFGAERENSDSCFGLSAAKRGALFSF